MKGTYFNLKRIFMVLIAAIVIAGTITCSAAAASKRIEIKTSLSSYKKLKTKIGNLQLTPKMDPLESKTEILFMNKKGEDQGIIGRYIKRTGKVCMFQNRYRKDLSCYGVYLGKKYKDVKTTLKKNKFKQINHWKYKGGGKNGANRYVDKYQYGSKTMQIWSEDGGRSVTCYAYYAK